MELADRVNAALQLDQLDLPPKPRVMRLEWEPYEDSQGDESLKVWVILADDTADEELKHAPAINRTIRDTLLSGNVSLYPYVYFALESEFAEMQKA